MASLVPVAVVVVEEADNTEVADRAAVGVAIAAEVAMVAMVGQPAPTVYTAVGTVDSVAGVATAFVVVEMVVGIVT